DKAICSAVKSIFFVPLQTEKYRIMNFELIVGEGNILFQKHLKTTEFTNQRFNWLLYINFRRLNFQINKIWLFNAVL
ncbi:MAG: hypothetical protein ACYC25_05765, partial [Paludibacter sp.]